MKQVTCRFLAMIAAVSALSLSACVIESEVRERVAVNGEQLSAARIAPGQVIRVETLEGEVFSATFIAVTDTDLVSRQRTTYSSIEQKTPLKKVSAVSYERVVGTRVETVRFPNLPMGNIIPLGPSIMK